MGPGGMSMGGYGPPGGYYMGSPGGGYPGGPMMPSSSSDGGDPSPTGFSGHMMHSHPPFPPPLPPHGRPEGATNGVTGCPPVPLYMPCDDESLSAYQCLVRRNIELFEARDTDVDSSK